MKAFQYVLDKHGLRPEDAVMVGDSIRTDFASRRVGIRAIIVDRFNKYGSDKTIKDLRLLKDMLR